MMNDALQPGEDYIIVDVRRTDLDVRSGIADLVTQADRLFASRKHQTTLFTHRPLTSQLNNFTRLCP